MIEVVLKVTSQFVVFQPRSQGVREKTQGTRLVMFRTVVVILVFFSALMKIITKRCENVDEGICFLR